MSTLKVTHLQNESNSAPSISISSAVGGGVTFAGISTFHGAVKLEDGLHGNSTDTITASTNGSERLRISSTGKVRVGSGNAAYNLEIYGSGAQELLIGSTNASLAGILLDGDSNGDGSGGDYAQIFHNTDGTLNFRSRNGSGGTDTIFYSNTTETLRIASAGSVLMGGQSSSYDGGFVNLELRKDSNTVGGSMTLVNDTASQAGATCEIDCYQNYRSAGKIVFGRENANNWQAAAAGADSFLAFHTNDSGVQAERLRITSAGDVKINDGNLVIGTSGHGIDFSVTGDGSGTIGTNGELLDEYEEGFFTPTIVNGFSSANLQYKAGRYTRIGNHVYCDFYIRFDTGAEANGNPIQIGGLPFTISNLTYGAPGATARLTRGGGGTTYQDLALNDGNITFYGSANNSIFNCYVGGTAWATVTTGGGANAKFIIGFYQYHAD